MAASLSVSQSSLSVCKNTTVSQSVSQPLSVSQSSRVRSGLRWFCQSVSLEAACGARSRQVGEDWSDRAGCVSLMSEVVTVWRDQSSLVMHEVDCLRFCQFCLQVNEVLTCRRRPEEPSGYAVFIMWSLHTCHVYLL